jgi:alpha-tubulin suppressor-like RCC1 family protein
MDRKIAFLLSVLMLAGLVYPTTPYQAAIASPPPGLPPSTADQDPLIAGRSQPGNQATRQSGNQATGQPGIGTVGDDSRQAMLAGMPAALPVYTGLAARNYYTCALTKAGGVQCWGDNRFGQLGVGDDLSRSNPVDVVFSGLTGKVSQVAPGGYHTCALTTTGEVWCWGRNTKGQLGDGTTTDQNVPVRVIPAASGVVRLSAGGYHTCALYASGIYAGSNIQCWGDNEYGQLGDGSLINRSAPVPVPVASLGGLAAALETGWYHTCAIVVGSGVKCWGYNDDGQLGNNSQTNSSQPVSVAGLPSKAFSSLAAGYFHTCALSASGGVWCWGGNNFGQLGDGSTTMRLKAVAVTTLTSGVLEIGAGYVHTCARLATGVKCWGSNEFGQLGDNTQINNSQPTPVTGLPAGVTALAVGGSHTCVLTGSAARCWGWDNYGQLGNGSPPVMVLPTPVSGLASGAAALSSGALHTCALALGGQAWCWGNNGSGQLGNDTTIHSGTPVAVQSLPGNVTLLAADEAHTCALLGSGGVWCWGANGSGQLGSGSFSLNSPLPVGVSGLSGGVIDIAAKGDHTCALISPGGMVKCWGLNNMGQLGDGTTANRSKPVTVNGPAGGYTALAAGLYHTCALTSHGTVQCWGDNEYGQLGDGSTATRLTPTYVSGLSGVVSLAAGADHTCALTSTKQVKCWGLNLNGQLGLGNLIEQHAPTLVAGLSGVTAITAGAYHTCALLGTPPDAGTVRCWGQNNYFQLGSGNSGDQTSPVAVQGLAEGIQAISAGTSHTCALVGPDGLVGTGTLVCWGWTGYGQLGTLPVPWQLRPVAVTGQQVFLAGFGKHCLENRALAFTLLDFAYHFSAASGRGLQKIEIASLPTSGSLKLGGLPVTAGQEIEYTQLNNLSFTPASGWIGTTSFTWNGSDGSVVSLIMATVTLTVTTSVYLPIVRH